jgi:hypothetical protein
MITEGNRQKKAELLLTLLCSLRTEYGFPFFFALSPAM